MNRTLEEIDAEIAKLQAERERIANGGFKKGEKIWYLDHDGDIRNDEWNGSWIAIEVKKRGRITRTREELEAKDRREVIETQMLKYADWECEDPCVLYVDSSGNVNWYYSSENKYGAIPMSPESAKRCLEEMNHDDLKFYLTWGRG